MLSYWANFAKTGNPNDEGLPNWKLYSGSGDGVMELGANVNKINDRCLDVYPIIDKIIERKTNETTL